MFVQRTRILQISLFAILSAFVLEFIFGVLSNSLALLTDSIHALLDSVVTIVLLLATKMALKPPDSKHTYGHGKIESLGGLFGGIAILIIAVFFINESITHLQNPTPAIVPNILGLVGAFYVIGVDIFRIVLLGKSIKKIGGSTLVADFYHALMDLGSTMIAIVGILLTTYGLYNADFAAALILGVLLVGLSIKLIHKTALDLTDVISPDMVSKVKQIATNTEGVIDADPILMRRSGETIFADVTISLRGDVSFDQAHKISSETERNIKNEISNSKITIHFEPNWEDVPLDSKINDIVLSVNGVKGVHNISSYSSEGKIFVSLHVMVQREINLEEAHKISEIIEEKIQKNIQQTNHVTIHLEPFVTIPDKFEIKGKITKEKIAKLIKECHPEIKNINRVITLQFKDILKIDIDCSFDRNLSIQKVHDLTSLIEANIRKRYKNAIITIHPEPF